MKCHFIMPVWGASYTHELLTYCLPSLLASGNIPAWPWNEDSLFCFYTSLCDWQTIQNHAVFHRLKQYISIQQILFDTQDSDKYKLLSHCCQQAFDCAMTARAAIVPLAPDHIVANCTLYNLSQLIQQGKEYVICASVRILATAVQNTLNKNQENILNVTAIELIDLTFGDDLHPITQQSFLDEPMFTSWPSHIYWWFSPTCIAARCYHMHPLFIKYPQAIRTEDMKLLGMDGEHLQNYYGQRHTMVIITDNSIVIFSQASSDIHVGPPQWLKDKSARKRLVSNFGKNEECCHPIHLWFFEHRVLFQGSWRLALAYAKRCLKRQDILKARQVLEQELQPYQHIIDVQVLEYQVSMLEGKLKGLVALTKTHISTALQSSQPEKDLLQALKHLQQILYISTPAAYPLLIELAQACYALGQWKETKQVCQLGQELYPDTEIFWQLTSNVVYSIKNENK